MKLPVVMSLSLYDTNFYVLWKLQSGENIPLSSLTKYATGLLRYIVSGSPGIFHQDTLRLLSSPTISIPTLPQQSTHPALVGGNESPSNSTLPSILCFSALSLSISLSLY